MCVHVQTVEEEVELKKGSHVRVLTAESDKDKTDETTIWVDYRNLPRVLEKGSKIYIDDGLIGLKVLEIGKSLGFVGESKAVTREHGAALVGGSLVVVYKRSCLFFCCSPGTHQLIFTKGGAAERLGPSLNPDEFLSIPAPSFSPFITSASPALRS